MWLIVNNIKEQITPSCKICPEQTETHKSCNQCLSSPNVQMSGLCRHNASYEQHKDASRHAEKVIRSQVSHLF